MSIDDDLERRLENWARWYWGGGAHGVSTSSIYSQGPRSRRDGETPMPIINGEALDTDTAVGHLHKDLREALRARYLRLAPAGYTMRTLSEVQVASALLVSYGTYLRRQNAAKVALRASLRAAREGACIKA